MTQRGSGRSDRKARVCHRSRVLVADADVDARDRNHAARAAAHDCLAQHMNAVGREHGRRLDLVGRHICTAMACSLAADGVDARVGPDPWFGPEVRRETSLAPIGIRRIQPG
jgi:hypothetical protein